MCWFNRWIIIVLILLFSISCNANEIKKYNLYFYKYTKEYFGDFVDWKYFKAQGIAESALIYDAVSWVGAAGIMQIMPGTWKDLTDKLGFKIDGIFDPEYNIAAGIYYNRYLWNNWRAKRTVKDRLKLMYACYNGGLKNVLDSQKICIITNTCEDCNSWSCISSYADKVDSWKHEESLTYVERIFKIYERIQGE